MASRLVFDDLCTHSVVSDAPCRSQKLCHFCTTRSESFTAMSVLRAS